jgi:hypothetical protein
MPAEAADMANVRRLMGRPEFLRIPVSSCLLIAVLIF